MNRRLVLVGGDTPLSHRLVGRLPAARLVTSDAGDPDELATLLLVGRNGRQPACLIYLAGERRGDGDGLPDPEDARRVLGGAAAAIAAAGASAATAGAAHVVVVSSAEVWEPSHHHPGLVAEEPLAPPRTGDPLAAAWRALEAAAAAALGDVPATMLRPAPVPVPGGGDWASRFLAGRLARLALPLPGFDPPLQLLDPDDLAAAIRAAAAAARPGIYHLAPAGVVRVRRAARLAGRWPVAVPSGLRRLPGSGPGTIPRLRHPATVSGERAAGELGFRAARSSAETIRRFAAGGAPRPDGGAGASAPIARTAPPPEPSYDDFGMEPEFIDRYGRTWLRFLHDLYWRIDVGGVERVPRAGRAVLVGMHRGFMPFDGVMALHAVRRATGRIPRFLIHPTLVKFPYLADFMTKLGGIHASRENADRVLAADGVLAIYPEGIRGAFTPYRRAYRLGKLGRDEFVRMALANRAPIVPFVTVGSAEIFPILARVRWRRFERLTEWPCLPITPTFPLLPVPLPSKWHTRYLEPLPVEDDWGPEAAADRRRVRAVSREVRRRMEAAIADLLARRRWIFFGGLAPVASTGPLASTETVANRESAA